MTPVTSNTTARLFYKLRDLRAAGAPAAEQDEVAAELHDAAQRVAITGRQLEALEHLHAGQAWPDSGTYSKINGNTAYALLEKGLATAQERGRYTVAQLTAAGAQRLETETNKPPRRCRDCRGTGNVLAGTPSERACRACGGTGNYDRKAT